MLLCLISHLWRTAGWLSFKYTFSTWNTLCLSKGQQYFACGFHQQAHCNKDYIGYNNKRELSSSLWLRADLHLCPQVTWWRWQVHGQKCLRAQRRRRNRPRRCWAALLSLWLLWYQTRHPSAAPNPSWLPQTGTTSTHISHGDCSIHTPWTWMIKLMKKEVDVDSSQWLKSHLMFKEVSFCSSQA